MISCSLPNPHTSTPVLKQRKRKSHSLLTRMRRWCKRKDFLGSVSLASGKKNEGFCLCTVEEGKQKKEVTRWLQAGSRDRLELQDLDLSHKTAGFSQLLLDSSHRCHWLGHNSRLVARDLEKNFTSLLLCASFPFYSPIASTSPPKTTWAIWQPLFRLMLATANVEGGV